MSQLSLGIILGIILVLLAYLLLPVFSGEVTDDEVEAWLEWRLERKKREKERE